jgi:hypothetical protein
MKCGFEFVGYEASLDRNHYGAEEGDWLEPA